MVEVLLLLHSAPPATLVSGRLAQQQEWASADRTVQRWASAALSLAPGNWTGVTSSAGPRQGTLIEGTLSGAQRGSSAAAAAGLLATRL